MAIGQISVSVFAREGHLFPQGHADSCGYVSPPRPPAAQQLPIGSAEVSIQGRVQDGVDNGVKVAQPQHHRVGSGRGVSLCPDAHAGKEGVIGEPADNEGPQDCC